MYIMSLLYLPQPFESVLPLINNPGFAKNKPPALEALNKVQPPAPFGLLTAKNVFLCLVFPRTTQNWGAQQ